MYCGDHKCAPYYMDSEGHLKPWIPMKGDSVSLVIPPLIIKPLTAVIREIEASRRGGGLITMEEGWEVVEVLMVSYMPMGEERLFWKEGISKRRESDGFHVLGIPKTAPSTFNKGRLLDF
jgi:hypothetical protein